MAAARAGGLGRAPLDPARLQLPAPEPLAARPATSVATGDVADMPWGRGDVSALRRHIGEALGCVRSGIQQAAVAPGMRSAPPHCHSSEEELFVVLEGDGVVVLGDEEHPVRPGSLVGRPAGSRVAHSFLAGPSGLKLLAYSDQVAGDMCFYPRSNMVGLLGLGTYFLVEPVDYWDAEGGF